ncbi:cyclic nucleotide-gated ion channel 1-like isoform X2 [Alnus glutinosa]|uniref:cyclic nucleotide-gated ion channel 1-like isoform X2 n=1 Tax=Alnus glutinosa TaxID=3517 RepID=UPI002D79846E|nr:cyclic nucleotide-gated ion channel 1-like isoform X2 [Alnus glutinosa]
MRQRWRQQENGERDQDIIQWQFPKNESNDGFDTTKKTILHPEGWLCRRWNMMFVTSCAIALSLDPLFLYVPVIKKDNKCVAFDKGLKIIAISLRLLTDMIYVANITLQFISPYKNESLHALGRNEVVTDSWKIAKRILRIHCSRKMLIGLGNKRARNVSIEAAFNFFLYILASHVLGALWYFFSIQQESNCWQIACENHIGCTPSTGFRCDHSSGNYTFLNDYCPVNPPNITLFDFGIFLGALQSGIIASTNFPPKFSHCFWWGLRNLSSFGQNLQTSTLFWENFFAVSICISGLLLFLYLIGNLQIYMQLETFMWLENEKTNETMKATKKAKEQDIELWMHRNQLPLSLIQQVRPHVRRMIEENKDIDARSPLPHLPKEITKEIMRCMYWPLLRRVPMFEKMDERLLDELFDGLKPVFHPENSYIVWERETVTEMSFIMRGKLLTMTTTGGRAGFVNTYYLNAGDFCGEELLTWALDPHSLSYLPISTRIVQALTEVEAFTLKSDSLKFVATLFRRLYGKQEALHTFRYCSQQWKTWAAGFIQAAWYRYRKKKLEMSLRADGNYMLQDALAKAGGSGGSSPSLGASIDAARFASNALRTLRSNSARKLARVQGRIPPMFPHKPAEPDFTYEEQ